jgi:VanZ family protein
MRGGEITGDGGGRRRASGQAGRHPLVPGWGWAVLLVVAVAAHLVVLYLPGQDVPQTGFEVPGLDKAIHVVAFGVPTLAAVVLGRSAWWALPFVVHAPVSEAVQATFVPHRSGDPWDVAADLVGVALAVVLAVWLRRGLESGREREYASRVPPARE